MPFIHIKSLPMADTAEIPRILESISKDFAADTAVDLEHITATWEYFKAGHYCTAGVAAPSFQPKDAHPVIVDLLTPDFNENDVIERMLNSIAVSLRKHTGIHRKNIFIHHRMARSGSVFDNGDVVRW